MISKLYNYWQILRGNLWFFPAFVCFLYALATTGLYYFESTYLQDTEFSAIIFNGDSGDAKSLAITLLSSMITMATLAISITMVVLSLAATQLGPRLIRSFMSDHKTKTFISLFFGAVIACFLLTMILHDVAPGGYTPSITITAVFAICFANLFVLLAFVHHVAISSIADEVITKVAGSLNQSLERLTVSEDDEEQKVQNPSDWPKDFDKKKKSLKFERSGYVQQIQYDRLLEIAADHSLFIQIHFKAGHFLVDGEGGLDVYPKSNLDEDIDGQILDCFIVGTARTPTRDIEYSIRHLVEIGLRAQSPGINDNFTAITVLDHLSAALAILFQKETPSQWMEDEEGRVRIWAKQSDESDIIFSALDQMRHNAREKPDVIHHILKKMKVLCELSRTDAQIRGLRNQLTELEHDLKYLADMVVNIENTETLCAELQEILDAKGTNL